MQKQNSFCYHWIQNCAHGKFEIRRKDDGLVEVVIGLALYNLDIDIRDTRVLICFDGQIPSGGLPKGSTVIRSEVNPILVCDLARVYKKRDPEEEEPLYTIKGKKAEQETTRYFILLQTGRAVFRMFKTDTLQPRYLSVDVRDGCAEFSTSSY